MNTPTESALLYAFVHKEKKHYLETELMYRATLVGEGDEDAKNSFNKLLSQYWDILDPARQTDRVEFADKMADFDKVFKDRTIVIKEQ